MLKKTVAIILFALATVNLRTNSRIAAPKQGANARVSITGNVIPVLPVLRY